MSDLDGLLPVVLLLMVQLFVFSIHNLGKARILKKEVSEKIALIERETETVQEKYDWMKKEAEKISAIQSAIEGALNKANEEDVESALKMWNESIDLIEAIYRD